MAKSELMTALAFKDTIRIVAIDGKELVEKARQLHQLTPTTSAVLGRTLIGSLLLGYGLENEETLTVRIAGNGPVQEVVTHVREGGKVRGYVSHPSVDLPLKPNGKLDVSSAVGTQGMLRVTKHLGLSHDFTGNTPLVSGEIAEDFTHYLLQSEQIPSAVALGVLVDVDGSILAAGGYLIQVLPGTDEATLSTLEKRIENLPSVTRLLQEQRGAEHLIHTLIDGPVNIFQSYPISFSCTCSRERTQSTLIMLGESELIAMANSTEITDVHCNFCNQHYDFTAKDVHSLLEKIKATKA